MIKYDELLALMDQNVILRFTDGSVYHARLFWVELDYPYEIIYDILEVVEAGDRDFAWVKPGMTLSTDPNTELVSIQKA